MPASYWCRMASKHGRPVASIDADLLENFLQQGFTVATIAGEGLLGKTLHYNTVHNFMKKNGMVPIRSRYSQISFDDLLKNVSAIHEEFPKSGYREVQSMLATQTPSLRVQERRVRAALKCADPSGTLERQRSTLKRRVYKVLSCSYL